MTHPIEEESYRVLAERADLSAWAPDERAVVARVIHASADVEYASTMWLSPGAVEAGVAALRRKAPVIADVEMVRHGISGLDVACYLDDRDPVADGPPPLTRAARGVRAAARRHPIGAVVVIGCAPTALVEVVRLAEAGVFRPDLVVGLPVGFVGAAEAKAALRASRLPAVGNVGEKGGSAVAAAAANAIARLAGATSTRGTSP